MPSDEDRRYYRTGVRRHPVLQAQERLPLPPSAFGHRPRFGKKVRVSIKFYSKLVNFTECRGNYRSVKKVAPGSYHFYIEGCLVHTGQKRPISDSPSRFDHDRGRPHHDVRWCSPLRDVHGQRKGARARARARSLLHTRTCLHAMRVPTPRMPGL